MYSAKIQTGIATNPSIIECCFMNTVERQTNMQNTTIADFVHQAADFSLSQIDAIPIEYATCSEGQTLEFVSPA